MKNEKGISLIALIFVIVVLVLLACISIALVVSNENNVTVNGGGIGVMPYYFNKIEKNLICLDNIECKITNTLYLTSPKNRKDVPKVKAIINYYKDLISNL